MKLSKALWISVQVAIGATIVVVASVLVADYFDIYQTVKPYVVMSGSMEPAIKLGSVAIVRPQLSYSSGDVITYSQDGNQDQPITHRVVFRQFPQGLGSDPEYLTAGDANEDFDRAPVKNENVIGKVVFSIPYLGYAVNLAKQPYGFILLVIVPATIVIYEELKTAIRELLKIAKRLATKARSRNREKVKSSSPKIEFIKRQNRSLPKIVSLLPIIGSIFVFASLSGSFFQDMEDSIGNIFEAAETYAEPEESTPTPTPIPGEPTPTPTPTPPENTLVVINEVYSEGRAKGEWVELHNLTGDPLDVSGWKISDKNAFTNAQDDTLPLLSIIPANGYALIITNQSTVDTVPVPVTTPIFQLTSANIGSGLNDGGDAVVLKDTIDVIHDAMSYGNETIIFETPPSAPNSGETVARIPNGTDTDTAADWQIDTSPTIGDENSL